MLSPLRGDADPASTQSRAGLPRSQANLIAGYSLPFSGPNSRRLGTRKESLGLGILDGQASSVTRIISVSPAGDRRRDVLSEDIPVYI